MKSSPIFVAAAGFAMVGACSVTTKEDNAAADENNAAPAAAVEGNVLPMTDEDAQGGQVDTLGNQLDQLNGDTSTAANTASDQH